MHNEIKINTSDSYKQERNRFYLNIYAEHLNSFIIDSKGINDRTVIPEDEYAGNSLL